jgi:hypothetical protein
MTRQNVIKFSSKNGKINRNLITRGNFMLNLRQYVKELWPTLKICHMRYLFEVYPKNKIRLQILPLQHCGHYGAHPCRVCWPFWKAQTQFADNQTTFSHHPVCLQCSRKSRSPPLSVIRFLNARNMKPADIHKVCEVYREHAMSDSMVKRRVRHFNQGRKNVHDDRQSSRPSVVNEDLVCAVEEKIQENRRFTISSLSLQVS